MNISSALLITAGLLCGCSSPPKFRVTSGASYLDARAQPGQIPVVVGHPDYDNLEVLGKVWAFQWASNGFSTVSEKDLLYQLSVPGGALGAEQIVGAQSSTLCVFEGWVGGLGNDIAETEGMAMWASGLAVRPRGATHMHEPEPYILALDPILGVKPSSSLDVLIRAGVRSILEQRGYYVQMVDGEDEYKAPVGSRFSGTLSGSGPVTLTCKISSLSGQVLWEGSRELALKGGEDDELWTDTGFFAGQGVTGGGLGDGLYENLYELLQSVPTLAKDL